MKKYFRVRYMLTLPCYFAMAFFIPDASFWKVFGIYATLFVVDILSFIGTLIDRK